MSPNTREIFTPDPFDSSKIALPICDYDECENDAPFQIRSPNGPVNRCRNCLRKDLAADWWRYE